MTVRVLIALVLQPGRVMCESQRRRAAAAGYPRDAKAVLELREGAVGLGESSSTYVHNADLALPGPGNVSN